MTLTEKLLADGLVVIARQVPSEELLPTAQALWAGGVRFLEVTLNTPGALEQIRALNEHFEDMGMTIGAGTVMNAGQARAALGAGARFLVSPHTDTEVIRIALEQGAVAMPGVATPTEAETALKAGARVLKLFPAGALGPAYLKQITAPFNQAAFFAVGGIDLANAAAFMTAGAAGLGVGDFLVDKKVIARGDFRTLTDRAATLRDILDEARM